MSTTERRNAIMKTLFRRRYETITNLATEFEVSERTIRRDIEILSYTEPLYTQPGRNGGVYVVEGYQANQMYLTEEETGLLFKIREAVNMQDAILLLPGERAVLDGMIRNYAKPKNK